MLNNQLSINDCQKVVGIGIVVLTDSSKQKAENHWYQCKGVGKCMMKVKRWKK